MVPSQALCLDTSTLGLIPLRGFPVKTTWMQTRPAGETQGQASGYRKKFSPRLHALEKGCQSRKLYQNRHRVSDWSSMPPLPCPPTSQVRVTPLLTNKFAKDRGMGKRTVRERRGGHAWPHLETTNIIGWGPRGCVLGCLELSPEASAGSSAVFSTTQVSSELGSGPPSRDPQSRLC